MRREAVTDYKHVTLAGVTLYLIKVVFIAAERRDVYSGAIRFNQIRREKFSPSL